jgi:branched-chain amino acid transport system permease protein
MVAAVLVIAPAFSPPQYVLSTLTTGMVLVILTCSWDILAGFTGQVSFGHAAFFGLGAYISILPMHHFGVGPWIAFAMGPLGAAVVGAVVGMICLRLRGPYLALMTLALAQIVELLIVMSTDFTRGQLGISGYEGLLAAENRIGYYYIALLLVCIVVGGLHIFARSSHGLILRTIREDEVKAESIGVNTTRYKVFAFVLSSLIAGLAGSFYAFFVQVLTPGVFDVRFSALPIGMTILGGAGSIFGPALFALGFEIVSEVLKPVGVAYDLLLLGVLIIAGVMYLPKGLWPLLNLKKMRPDELPARVSSKLETPR